MAGLAEAVRAEIAVAEGRRDEFVRLLAEVESDLETLEDMLPLAVRLERAEVEPAPEQPEVAKKRARRREPERRREAVAPGPLDQQIVGVLSSSPVWLRRGEIERMLPGVVNASTVKRSLDRLVKLRSIACQGERAGTRYGGPSFLGHAGRSDEAPGSKQKPPPLPKEPDGTWARDSKNGDADPAESCRVGDCVRVARENGFCDEHVAFGSKFSVSV